MRRMCILFLGCVTAISLAACGPAGPKPMADIVRHSEYKAALDIPSDIVAGAPSILILHLSLDGRPYSVDRDARMIHIVLASDDMQDIYHFVQPTVMEEGTYEIPYTFTRPGRYRLWLELGDVRKELHHGESADLIAAADLQVSGSPVPPAVPVTEGKTAQADGFTVTLETGNAMAGRPAELRLNVRDANGKDMTLYENEPVFYALTRPGLDYFGHGHMKTGSDKVSAPLTVTFPASGDYLFFAHILFYEESKDPSVGIEFRDVEVHFLIPVS